MAAAIDFAEQQVAQLLQRLAGRANEGDPSARLSPVLIAGIAMSVQRP